MHHIELATVVTWANGMQGLGPPEVATGGEDGAVRVWDTRQRDAPVAAFSPADADKVAPTAQHLHGTIMLETLPFADVLLRMLGANYSWFTRECTPAVPLLLTQVYQWGGQARNCWAVAFGDCHSADDRCLLAGYDNGDVKMFDLRTNSCVPPLTPTHTRVTEGFMAITDADPQWGVLIQSLLI